AANVQRPLGEARARSRSGRAVDFRRVGSRRRRRPDARDQPASAQLPSPDLAEPAARLARVSAADARHAGGAAVRRRLPPGAQPPQPRRARGALELIARATAGAPGTRMTTMTPATRPAMAVALGTLFALTVNLDVYTRAQPQPPLRLYVFDCGTLEGDPARFNMKREEMKTSDMSVACYLIVHTKGALIWDTGAVPDSDVRVENQRTRHHIVLTNTERYVTLAKSLKAQIAEAGYAPRDIAFIALSHYHWDHTANANAFARATW